ncbi:MAG TPA: GAF domain-containing protein, partial [Gaiellaceae bacterium]|nr:GAF domain-containing protein [Gaiellaceae bacterium]
MARTRDRTQALVEAGIALSSELSLGAVLQKLVETAATLTGARYAALGVLDPSGQRLERFLTIGVDEAEREAIGDVPTGRGILGVLIREATPLRLHDLTDDPRSVGFPPGHPPMTSFLGVPIALRGVAYGNLYLTEKEGGADFTEDDEEAVVMLGSQAAVAIENARLYESATRWSAQLESLNEVMNVLVTEFDLTRLLQLIATRLRDLLGARTVTIALPHGAAARIEAAAGEDGETYVGLQLAHRSKTMRVLERRRSERVDSVLDDPEVDHESARRLGARTSLYVPLVVRGAAMGVIAAHDKQGPDPRFSDDDVRIAEIFAGRAAVAVELSQRVARDALQRVVTAQELERRRLARELHDETGQA